MNIKSQFWADIYEFRQLDYIFGLRGIEKPRRQICKNIIHIVLRKPSRSTFEHILASSAYYLARCNPMWRLHTKTTIREIHDENKPSTFRTYDPLEFSRPFGNSAPHFKISPQTKGMGVTPDKVIRWRGHNMLKNTSRGFSQNNMYIIFCKFDDKGFS